jgi:hypothetical protein
MASRDWSRRVDLPRVLQLVQTCNNHLNYPHNDSITRSVVHPMVSVFPAVSLCVTCHPPRSISKPHQKPRPLSGQNDLSDRHPLAPPGNLCSSTSLQFPSTCFAPRGLHSSSVPTARASQHGLTEQLGDGTTELAGGHLLELNPKLRIGHFSVAVKLSPVSDLARSRSLAPALLRQKKSKKDWSGQRRWVDVPELPSRGSERRIDHASDW